MVSIIIPVYNVEEYLNRCLQSLCLDSVSIDCEVIVVNDGSTDRSLQICNEFANHYRQFVKVIDKGNGGLSDARNVGMQYATGDYVYFLDSDDWLEEEAIEVLYKTAIRNDCDVVQGGFYYSYDGYRLMDSRLSSNMTKILDNRSAMRELVKNDIIKNFAWGKLYRRTLISDLPFKKSVYYEDSFWQHHVMHRVGKYGLVNKPLYNYRQRGNSISGHFSINNYDLIVGYLERYAYINEYYPSLIQYMTRSIESVFWAFYGVSRNNKELKQRFETLFGSYLQLAKETHRSIGFKANFLSRSAKLFPVIDLFFRINRRFQPPKFINLSNSEV